MIYKRKENVDLMKETVKKEVLAYNKKFYRQIILYAMYGETIKTDRLDKILIKRYSKRQENVFSD
jgi:hypothetical protein